MPLRNDCHINRPIWALIRCILVVVVTLNPSDADRVRAADVVSTLCPDERKFAVVDSSEERAYAALLATATNPITVVCRYGAEPVYTCGIVARFPGTSALAELRSSELMFAFLPDSALKVPDFRRQPGLLSAIRSNIFRPGIGPYDCSPSATVPYDSLRLFVPYYADFRAQHTTALAQQAAASTFEDTLRSVHSRYAGIAAALDTTLFVSFVVGLVIRDTDYSFERHALEVDLGSQRVLLEQLARATQGETSFRVYGSEYDCNCASGWLNFDAGLELLSIRCTPDDAGAIVAGINKRRWGQVTFLYRFTGFTECGPCQEPVTGTNYGGQYPSHASAGELVVGKIRVVGWKAEIPCGKAVVTVARTSPAEGRDRAP